MGSPWSMEALRARLADPARKLRYAAGSPDTGEVAVYARFLDEVVTAVPMASRRAVVLGMTPELRALALDHGCHVTCVDSSVEAIRLLRPWVHGGHSTQEVVHQADWFHLEELVDEPAHVVLADGAFGNLLTLEDHARLLEVIAGVLVPGGALLARNILVPEGMPGPEHEAGHLVSSFRAGELDEAEFGFAMRIWGSHGSCYDAASYLLDNTCVFARYQDWASTGRLTAGEHAIVRRYYFGGRNLVPPRALLEDLLTAAGFDVRRVELAGKDWHRYYPVHGCRLRAQ